MQEYIGGLSQIGGTFGTIALRAPVSAANVAIFIAKIEALKAFSFGDQQANYQELLDTIATSRAFYASGISASTSGSTLISGFIANIQAQINAFLSGGA